jgi:polysaccharide biosynthesis transport protein
MYSGGPSTVAPPSDTWVAPHRRPDVPDDRPATVSEPSVAKPDLMGVARLAVSGWWIALLVLAATVGAAAFTTGQRERVYRASSTLTVVPSDTVLGSREATINSINVLDRRTIPNTFAEIARSRSMLETAGQKAGYAQAALRQVRSSAVVLPETFVVRITVDADEPEKAAVLANGVLEETGTYALSAYPSYQARQLDQATPSPTPVSPQPIRDIGVAVIVGIVLGLVAAFAVQYIRATSSQRASRDVRRRDAASR